MIARRALRTGDGSHWMSNESSVNGGIWGYGDNDLDTEDLKEFENLGF